MKQQVNFSGENVRKRQFVQSHSNGFTLTGQIERIKWQPCDLFLPLKTTCAHEFSLQLSPPVFSLLWDRENIRRRSGFRLCVTSSDEFFHDNYSCFIRLSPSSIQLKFITLTTVSHLIFHPHYTGTDISCDFMIMDLKRVTSCCSTILCCWQTCNTRVSCPSSVWPFVQNSLFSASLLISSFWHFVHQRQVDVNEILLLLTFTFSPHRVLHNKHLKSPTELAANSVPRSTNSQDIYIT